MVWLWGELHLNSEWAGFIDPLMVSVVSVGRVVVSPPL